MTRVPAERRGLLVAAVLGTVAVGAAAVVPEPALAHGLVGRQDLPIPRWLFGWGAAAVLIVSFVALAVLWPKPRLEDPEEKRLASLPRFLDPLCGAIGVALLALVVYAGYAGSQTATANLAPTFVYVLFWVGIPVFSLLLGDVFAAFNPWRAIARGASWVAGRFSGATPEPLAYPERLGRWPAALGIAVFVWVELIASNGDQPSVLATLALAYTAVQLVGMSLYGIDVWTSRADAFAVYFSLFARLSPLRWERGVLFGRRALSGVTSIDLVPGTVALVVVMIGTTTFDGFSDGPLFASIAPGLTDAVAALGISQATALQVAFTIVMIGVIAAIGGLYAIGVAGMRSVGNARDRGALAGRFAHTLVPIALAYVVAHYFSLLAYQGQATAYLASDPLGDGADLFGTATATIDYAWISATGIWYVQVGALVAGHVAGLVLAHDRALTEFDDVRSATRSQYWMLAIMVAFTSLGLWLLSASNS
jgi:hypothetical protein